MKNRRYAGLDTLRGLTLISMMAFHASWDLVYIFGVRWPWYHSFGAYVWQQSICWTFILLSGYCWQLGRRHLRRGLLVFGGGALVTAVTAIAMPEDLVLWGVLSFIGLAMLATIPLHSLFQRIPARLGLAGSFVLFTLFRDVNVGWLGFEGARILRLPAAWYSNLLTAGLGFPAHGFYSTDYFSFLPWVFLFWCGYFLYRLRSDEPSDLRLPVITAMGRHSLLVYLLHQPVIFGALMVWNLLR